MSRVAASLRLPVGIATALVAPLLLLEVVNRRGYGEGFPLFLFIVLWALPVGAALLVRPVVQSAHAGGLRERLCPVNLARLAVAATLVAVWTVIVLDQAPCFLGVPACD